jgi:hypothetical protein
MDTANATRWRSWWRLRVAVFFLLGLAAVDRLIAANARLWSRYDAGVYRKRILACRQRPRDVVIVGGSPCMCGLDPDALLGLPWRGRPVGDAFNCALPLATTTEVWLAIEHGLPTPPRLLIYGITATDLNDDRLEPQGPRELMDAADIATWARARPEATTWCLRHAAAARAAQAWQLYYHSEGIRLWSMDQAERLFPGLCPDAAAAARTRVELNALVSGGKLMTGPSTSPNRLDRLKAAGAIDPSFSFLDKYQLGTHVAYLERLLDWAQTKTVPLVLVDLPVCADLDERLCPQAFARYRALLTDVERARGVRVLRPTRASVGLDDSDFSDWVHLNASGAERLSRWLRHELARVDADGAGR